MMMMIVMNIKMVVICHNYDHSNSYRHENTGNYHYHNDIDHYSYYDDDL